jgi:hypothetical protein
MYFEWTRYILLKTCYLRIHIRTLSNISNILWKCSLHIMTTIHFECNSTSHGRSWYVTSLCPNTIACARLPNQMGEMTCIPGIPLSIIVRTFANGKEQTIWISDGYSSYGTTSTTALIEIRDLMHCLSIDKKWFWTSKLFWTDTNCFGRVQIILLRIKLDFSGLILKFGPVQNDLNP